MGSSFYAKTTFHIMKTKKKGGIIMVVIAVLGATLATILIIAINDADKEDKK